MSAGSRFGPHVALEDPAWIDPSATIYGKVRVCRGASVWPGAVLRAEMHEIVVGPFSNVQDLAVIHVGSHTSSEIGAHCSIAHRAVVHGAKLGDNCLVGIGATLMDGVVLGENCIVAGHCIVTEGLAVPPNSVVAGVPGKVVAQRDNWVRTRFNAFLYHWNAQAYARGEHRAWDGPEAQAKMAEEWARLEAEFARRAAPRDGSGT
jgi:carbonic anhydrase/acetyltransferase-like protein (isoleucine patch superfamily)